MTARFAPLLLGFTLASCAAVPPPVAEAQPRPPAAMSSVPPVPPPASPETTTGAAARAMSRQVLSGLADKIAEVRRFGSGPGYYLSGLELWERPVAAPYPGVCAVNVHRVGLEGLTERSRFQPDAQLEAAVRAGSVFTEIRFRMVGSNLRRTSAERPTAHEPECAALTSAATFFTAASAGDAHTALTAFEAAQRWANEPRARGAGIECIDTDGRPCSNGPEMLGVRLRADMITAVQRIECPSEFPCWRFNLADLRDGEGLWTVTVLGMNRPMRIQMRREMPPVL